MRGKTRKKEEGSARVIIIISKLLTNGKPNPKAKVQMNKNTRKNTCKKLHLVCWKCLEVGKKRINN